MADEGHEVANHSWSHPALTKLGADGFRKQIENTNDAIAKATGKRPVLMRPPYGATSSHSEQTPERGVWAQGYFVVGGSAGLEVPQFQSRL